MKVRIEHTFNLDEHELELARISYEAYADPDESFRDYIKSNLIIFVTANLIDAAGKNIRNEDNPNPDKTGGGSPVGGVGTDLSGGDGVLPPL